MTPTVEVIERRLRVASLLLVVGLAVQVSTLFWNHPLTFLAFIFIGSPLVLVGILLYLFSVLHKAD